MSEINSGKIITEEHKKSISNALRGKPIPKEILEKRIGKKRTQETKDAISKANAGKPKSKLHIEKVVKTRKDNNSYYHNEETKEKMRESHKNRPS